MYNSDIKELLEHCLIEIERTSKQKEASSINKVILKNVLENMRSILDYIAQDILNKLKQNPKNNELSDKIYFPYGQKENHFKKNIKRNFPTLKKDMPELYDLIESIQPFKLKDNWIVNLCELTNEVKHNNLSKTKDDKSITVKNKLVNITACKNLVIQDNYINGIKQDDVFFDGEEVHVVGNVGGSEITIENKIKFHGKALEIVPFLTNCFRNLEELSIKTSSLLSK